MENTCFKILKLLNFCKVHGGRHMTLKMKAGDLVQKRMTK